MTTPYPTSSSVAHAADGRPLTGPQRADFDRAYQAFHATASLKARDRVDGLKVAGDPEAAVKAAEDFVTQGGSDRLTLPSNDPIRADGGSRMYGEPAEVKALKASDKLADRYGPSSYGLSDYVKAVVTGDWARLPDATKSMSLSDALGGHLVPHPLSARIIDKARNASRVQAAGAISIPMETASLRIARLASDPTPAWKVENALIAASDSAFEAVTLTARTLAARLVMSVELAEDAPTVNDVIETALSGSLAVELDRRHVRDRRGPSAARPEEHGRHPGPVCRHERRCARLFHILQRRPVAVRGQCHGTLWRYLQSADSGQPGPPGGLHRAAPDPARVLPRPPESSRRRCRTTSHRAPRTRPRTPSWATGASSPSACARPSASRRRSRR